MTEYTIQAGEQNFSPPDPVGLTTRRGFRFRVAFHHSCYYSYLDDWGGDRDWFDVNKLCGLTLAYTPNNHLAYMAGWMPGNIQGHILVTPYTNYPASNFVTRREDSISVQTAESWEQAEEENRLVEGIVTRNSSMVYYTFRQAGRRVFGGKRMHVAHEFRLPWYMPWVGRRTGTWFGGEDNSPGRFGGEAPQAMKLWLEFETI